MNMKFMHTINAEDVRQFCIHNQLYTDGSVEDYNNLLTEISHHKPDFTASELYQIAKNIVDHSDGNDSEIDLSLENIVFYLCEDVMHTYVDVDVDF